MRSDESFRGSDSEGWSCCGIQFLETAQLLPNSEQDIIPDVNPTTIHFHLTIMRRFCDLYTKVESIAHDEQGKFAAIQSFLLCAASRYLRYLSLLKNFRKEVATIHNGRLETQALDFNEMMPLPPWDVAMILHAQFLSPTRVRIDTHCKEYLGVLDFDFPLKRLHSLIRDGIWNHAPSEEQWNANFSDSYQLWNEEPDARGSLKLPTLSRLFYPTEGMVTASCSAENRFLGMLNTISSKTEANLGMDLVSAALRQRTFAESIIHLASSEYFPLSTIRRAISRYRKFMLLMSQNHSLVPTIDIDLCWHTHQLFSRSYEQWCMHHLGCSIEHDDTVGSSTLNQGLMDTSWAWLKAYHEGYTSDNLKKAYFSKRRCIAGIVFPPYGVYIALKGKQLNRTKLS